MPPRNLQQRSKRKAIAAGGPSMQAHATQAAAWARQHPATSGVLKLNHGVRTNALEHGVRAHRLNQLSTRLVTSRLGVIWKRGRSAGGSGWFARPRQLAPSRTQLGSLLVSGKIKMGRCGILGGRLRLSKGWDFHLISLGVCRCHPENLCLCQSSTGLLATPLETAG